MNTQNKLVAGIVVAILIGVAGWFHGGQPGPAGENGQTLGNVPGNEIQGPSLVVGGLQHDFLRIPMSLGTTSICRIVSPPYTTVLVPSSFTVNFTTSTTTASNVVIATSTAGSTATTTLVAQKGLAANQTGALVATTTTSSLVDFVVAANTWFNVSMTGGQGTMTPVGFCSAEFIRM